MGSSWLKSIERDISLYRWVGRELSLPLFRDALSPLFGLALFRPRIDWHTIKRRVGEAVVVVGAGPTLEAKAESGSLSGIDMPIICADGAVKALLDVGLVPDIVVTDLDGDPSALIEAYRRGSIFVVLCHGDNIDKQIFFHDKIPKVFLTSQVCPIPPLVRNIGGFTDGDRAIHLAARYGARRIFTVGMDFGRRIGRYSLGVPKDLERKLFKLRIGRILVVRASKLYDVSISRI